MFGPRHLGYGEDRVDELLERLRLTELVDANPYTLSGGEKRRLSVATVLAAHPQVLVLDEPTFGQDANTWAELASFLSELLDAGTAVVSVTHDAEFSAVLGGAELRLRPRETAAADAPGPDLRAAGGGLAMRDALSLRGNHALLTRANPLAKFTAVTLITLVLALSIDWVSASVALAFELLLLPLAGPDRGLAVAARLAADPRRGAGRLEHRHPGARLPDPSCSTRGSGPSAPVPCSWGSASCSAGSRSHCPRCC